jgi:Tfp pilus assembly protein PilV
MSVDTQLRRLAAFLVAAGLVAVVGLVFEALLFARSDDKLGILCFSNAITGVVAGALYVQSRLREWEKQQVLEERLRKIADMNHHVRNALAVVQFYGTQREDCYATEAVAEAVKRIEWTLREVLPKGWNVDTVVAENVLKRTRAACSGMN